MFVFYGVKSKKEAEFFKNKYNFYYYEENRELYLRYGMLNPELQNYWIYSAKVRTTGYSLDKNIYVKSKGMECIDFEDFIRFIK